MFIKFHIITIFYHYFKLLNQIVIINLLEKGCELQIVPLVIRDIKKIHSVCSKNKFIILRNYSYLIMEILR